MLQPVITASSTHEGVWAASWCDTGEEPQNLEFNVRGAYQLETDTFQMPDIRGDTYTVVEYIVEPQDRG